VVTQSYHPVKHITTGEGGSVLTNNSELDKKIRRLRTHGMTKDKNILEQNDGPWYYEMHELGYNYRITDFQCALGSSQLKKLDYFVQKRRQFAKRYDELLIGIDNLTIPESQMNVEHSYHLYPLQIDFEKLSLTKVQFFEKMKKADINLQVHYIPIHLQPYYIKNFGFQRGNYPIAESFYNRGVSLPIYPDLPDNDASSVSNKILEKIKL
jgi:dTDP-4-amino-4,6-dideoxygalactose transaminase